MSAVAQTCEARTRKNRQCTRWSFEEGLCRQHLQVKAAGRLVTRFIADCSEEAYPPEIATAASAEVARGPSSPCPAESRALTVTNPCQALTRKHQQCKNERVSGGLCETHLEMEKEGRSVPRFTAVSSTSKAAGPSPGAASKAGSSRDGPSTPSPPARVRGVTCEALTATGLGPRCTRSANLDGLCGTHLKMEKEGRAVTRIGGGSRDGAALVVADALQQEPSTPSPPARVRGASCEALTATGLRPRGTRSANLDGLCGIHLKMEKEGRAVTRIGGGSRDGAAAVGDAATVVVGKLAEAPWKRLSIKPVAGRLVTTSRPSIRPEIPDDPPSPQSPLCPVPLLPYAARPATIRKGYSSWSHKTRKEELGCAVHHLPHTSQVTGVRGTTTDTASRGWLDMWASVCKASLTRKCFAKGCQTEVEVGAHVWLFDFKHQRYDHEHCYIVPLCKRHNAREFDYPHPFLLKRDVAVLRIVPHECYLDYGPLPS